MQILIFDDDVKIPTKLMWKSIFIGEKKNLDIRVIKNRFLKEEDALGFINSTEIVFNMLKYNNASKK